METLEASTEFRASHPLASTPDQLGSDAPQLQSISQKFPPLLLYTLSAKGYEELRTFFNASMTQQPLAIIRPRTEAEVSAAIQALHARNITFGIRSCGHDLTAARTQGRDGVIIDLRTMDSIFLAEDKKSARIGSCARIVLVNGMTMDTDDHPDLLWVLRGAGNGNFGIVFELRIKLYPQTGFLAGMLRFATAEAGDVLTKLGEFERELPINFTGKATHLALPGVGPVLAWLFAWTLEDDNVYDGWAFLEKMKALGTPILNTVSTVCLGTIRLRRATCATVIHTAHERALGKRPGACYPLRTKHRIAAISAGIVDATAQATEYEEYKKWADDLADDLSKQLHALPYGYRNLRVRRRTWTEWPRMARRRWIG
ncbi:hypothetical protein LZ32DRAFT_617576 [Colletotrichum eremochloae]|nr:hypothetical protein LZ32DRAFT_617576 [Colletotrichum eremochloae]